MTTAANLRAQGLTVETVGSILGDTFPVDEAPMPTFRQVGNVRIYPEMAQGSEAWLEARRGLLTASEMKLIVTPATLKAARNEKERAHLYELLAQRVSGFVEPHYIGDDMLRGIEDEVEARIVYAKHYAPVHDCGFITNDKWGFTIGYSPDGLVGDDGLIEAKSRRQKFQLQTIIENVAEQTVPADFLVQCQTGLMVSERKWIDFISYSGGLPMAVVRAYPDDKVTAAIVEIAGAFEERISKALDQYREIVATRRLIPTTRKIVQEMF